MALPNSMAQAIEFVSKQDRALLLISRTRMALISGCLGTGGRRHRLLRELPGGEGGEHAARAHQFVVAAAFDDAAVVEA